MRRKERKTGKGGLCRVAAAILSLILMIVAVPWQAFAATPEFARSEEEWARLRDDRIEYGELADLIHEYNATVKKNQIDLNEFRKDYGKSNEEWADRYRELADDLESSLDYPDTSDSDYAAAMSSIVTSEMQIEKWRETADEAAEDYLTYYYDFSMAEALLVSAAQTNLIEYYLNQLQLQSDEKQLELTQETCRSVVSRQELGMATEAEVLLAQENLSRIEKQVRDDQAAIENVRQRLMVLLGRKHNDNPEIGNVPETDPARIAMMNPSADKALAVENSYTMKSNRQRLENAKSTDTKESLQKTISETEQSIGASLNASYQNVIASNAVYELNQAQARLEQNNLQMMLRQYQLGSSSYLDYLKQRVTAEQAEIAVETARINLFQAVQSYEWALNGLAGTS